jgi:hypothetical protein
MEGDDMRVSERLEDLDLAVKVLFELLVELCDLDRLDRYQSAGDLSRKYRASVHCLEGR